MHHYTLLTVANPTLHQIEKVLAVRPLFVVLTVSSMFLGQSDCISQDDVNLEQVLLCDSNDRTLSFHVSVRSGTLLMTNSRQSHPMGSTQTAVQYRKLHGQGLGGCGCPFSILRQEGTITHMEEAHCRGLWKRQRWKTGISFKPGQSSFFLGGFCAQQC